MASREEMVSHFMEKYTRRALIELARGKSVTFSDRGTKREIATEIVEAYHEEQAAVVDEPVEDVVEEVAVDLGEETQVEDTPEPVEKEIEEEVKECVEEVIEDTATETTTTSTSNTVIVLEPEAALDPPEPEVVLSVEDCERVGAAKARIEVASEAFNAAGQVPGPERDERRAAKAELYKLLGGDE